LPPTGNQTAPLNTSRTPESALGAVVPGSGGMQSLESTERKQVAAAMAESLNMSWDGPEARNGVVVAM